MKKTYALVRVARALMVDSNGRHWGYELSKQSGVRSGVIYPMLRRMVVEGWLTNGLEDDVQARKAKRLPRRYYELTGAGKSALNALIADANTNKAASRRL